MAHGSTSGTPEGHPGNATDPTRVALIAPDSIYRDAIERYLREQVWLELVGVVKEGDGGEQLLSGSDPDLVILRDSTTLQGLADAAPDACFVLIGVPESSHDMERLLRSGAVAFICADMDRQALELTLTAAAKGHTLLPHGLTSIPSADDNATEDSPRHHPGLDALTAREEEVLPLMALTNKQIGEELGIRAATVSAHVRSILRKLDVSNRTEAVIVFMRANPDAS